MNEVYRLADEAHEDSEIARETGLKP